MSGSGFLDTNILVYAVETDGSAPEKLAAALELVKGRSVCLSTQVLGEFYHAVTRPRRKVPLTHAEASAWVQVWKRHQVHSITVSHVDLALQLRAAISSPITMR